MQVKTNMPPDYSLMLACFDAISLSPCWPSMPTFDQYDFTITQTLTAGTKLLVFQVFKKSDPLQTINIPSELEVVSGGPEFLATPVSILKSTYKDGTDLHRASDKVSVFTHTEVQGAAELEEEEVYVQLNGGFFKRERPTDLPILATILDPIKKEAEFSPALSSMSGVVQRSMLQY